MALTRTLAPTRTPTSTSLTSTWTLSPSNLRYALPLPVQSPTAPFTTTLFALRPKASRILKLTLGTLIGVLGIIATWWALDLAMWTAAKDYWDHCKERKQLTGMESEECERVLAKELVEPVTWRSYFEKLPNPLERRWSKLTAREVRNHDEDGTIGGWVWGKGPERWHDIDPVEKWYVFGDASAHKRDQWTQRVEWKRGVDDDLEVLACCSDRNAAGPRPFEVVYALRKPSFWEKIAQLLGVDFGYKERMRMADLLREGGHNRNLTLGSRLETSRLHGSRADDAHDIQGKEADGWEIFEVKEISQHDELDGKSRVDNARELEAREADKWPLLEDRKTLPAEIVDDESRPDGMSSGPLMRYGRSRRPPRKHLVPNFPRSVDSVYERMINDLIARAENPGCIRCIQDHMYPNWVSEDVAQEGIRKQGDAAAMHGGMERYRILNGNSTCGYRYNFTYPHPYLDDWGERPAVPNGMVWSRAHPVSIDANCWELDTWSGTGYERHGLGALLDMFLEPEQREELAYDWQDWAHYLQWKYYIEVVTTHQVQGSVEYLNVNLKPMSERRPYSTHDIAKYVHLNIGSLTIFQAPEWVFWQDIRNATIVLTLFLVWLVEVPFGGWARRKREMVREEREKRRHERKRRKEEMRRKKKDSRLQGNEFDGNPEGDWVKVKVQRRTVKVKTS